VTRYYGGIKLGTGGLARAYGDAAKRVLEASRLKELRLTTDMEAAVPYPLLGALENYLAGEGAEITGKTFGEFISVRLRLPADREADFEAFYARLTAGKSSLAVLGRDYR
jgi:putative IMPACT (imprinted ancient) family translation regulator